MDCLINEYVSPISKKQTLILKVRKKKLKHPKRNEKILMYKHDR